MPSTIRLHRVLKTKPERLYRAFLDPDAMVKWLPPHGFTGKVHHIDARVGGTYKMSFKNFTTGSSHSGVTSAHGSTNSVVLDDNGKAAFQQYIRAGDALKAIARRLNNAVWHVFEQILPWVRHAAWILGLAGLGPKRRIKRDPLASRFIRRGFA